MSTVAENYSFGAVDSRSNPLNMPASRGIRVRNWVPDQNGALRLRFGYTALASSGAVVAGEIHSLTDYYQWDDTQYVIYGQGTHLRRRNAAGVVTDLKSDMSGAPWDTYRSKNRIHFGDGTNSVVWDGTTLRTNGIRVPTQAEADGADVFIGVRVPSSAESTATVVAHSAGGTFPAAVIGYQAHMCYFDPTYNLLGPSASIGAVQKTVLNEKITIATPPDLSAVNAAWIKLFGLTPDNGSDAGLACKAAAIAVTSATRAGSTVTVICSANHLLTTGDPVLFFGADEGWINGVRSVTVINATTFTFAWVGAAGALTGTMYAQALVFSANASAATVNITNNITNANFLCNASRGMDVAAVESDTPGYGFYFAFWNRITNAVGNRIAFGSRLLPLAKSTAYITGLPDMSGVDPEWSILVGRTSDGAKIPYAGVDTIGNTVYAYNKGGTLIYEVSGVSFDSELPIRNGVIPAADKYAKIGSRIWANPVNSPYIFRSESETDENRGTMLGIAAQSWSPDAFETFPTGDKITCIAEADDSLLAFSRHAAAVNDELAGIFKWRGTWHGIGCAGQRAIVNTPYGQFWVSGTRQLCTRGTSGPVPISDEYEKALLSKIGSAYLSEVQCVYLLDPDRLVDQIIIKARDVNGVPFEVVHDFKLRDSQSPNGQGYERVYQGALAAGNYVIAQIEDVNFIKRAWAGATDGNLYQLVDGYNDAGAEFDADLIELRNLGPNRTAASQIEYVGDKAVTISYIKYLNNKGVDDFAPVTMRTRLKASEDPALNGADLNHQYCGNLANGETQWAFVRLQLRSHSADAPASALNDPPHLPLESYGTVYLTRGYVEGERGPE